MAKNNKQPVMDQIKKGNIKIKSRLNILAEKLGLGSGVALITLLLVFVFSGIAYWFRTNQDLVVFSGPGYRLRLFLTTFPYLWLAMFVVFFTFLSYLLKKYDFSYKKPFIFITALVIGLIALLSIISYQHPLMANYYKKITRAKYTPKKEQLGFVVGEVIEVTNNGYFINTPNNQQFTVKYDPETILPSEPINTGDFVRAIGNLDKGTLDAKAIIKLNQQKRFFEITPFHRQQTPKFRHQRQK